MVKFLSIKGECALVMRDTRIKVIDKTLDIMEVLSAEEKLSLAEIARLTGIPTVQRTESCNHFKIAVMWKNRAPFTSWV